MRALTLREKRTIRIGAAAVAIYLTLFGGHWIWRFAKSKNQDYQKLVLEARKLSGDIKVYQAKAEAAQKLMEGFQLDPARLSRTTAVAQASIAIQKSAASGGIQVGPVRESPARAANKELATVQLEGVGPVPAVTGFLHSLQTIGFPLIIETLQLTPEMTKPGQVKLSLTILILDFDQWKEAPNA